MPAKAKVPVEIERLNLKLPKGLHDQLAEVVTKRQLWPSRQDFIVEAIKEKLERLRGPTADSGTSPRRRAAHK